MAPSFDSYNFDLLITRSGDQYRAYVIDAPGGDAEIVFELTFAPDEFSHLVQTTGPRRDLRSADLAEVDGEPTDLRQLPNENLA